MSLFKKGFSHYLDTGQYSDLVLISEHGKVKVHRLVLSYSSEVFRRMLMGEFREKYQQEIEIKYPGTFYSRFFKSDI